MHTHTHTHTHSVPYIYTHTQRALYIYTHTLIYRCRVPYIYTHTQSSFIANVTVELEFPTVSKMLFHTCMSVASKSMSAASKACQPLVKHVSS
jgi:hypothetical protein